MLWIPFHWLNISTAIFRVMYNGGGGMLNLFGSKGFSFNMNIINWCFQEILPISVVLLYLIHRRITLK